MSLKFLIIKDGIYVNIFAEKNVGSFCICKSYSHFYSKNTCELDIVFTRTVNILTTNELVNLTMLWRTGPWCFVFQKAESDLAYELQSAKERQKIRAEEIEIDVVERKKLIDIEEKEILRKEKELIATVKRPAEASAYKLETLAEGHRLVQSQIYSYRSGPIKTRYFILSYITRKFILHMWY